MATSKTAPKAVDTDSRFDQEEELTLFPAYVKPAVGDAIAVRVVALDNRDPNFSRMIFQLTQDRSIEGFKGGGDNAESVEVKTGDVFSTSVYAGLAGLAEYIGLEVRIRCEGTRSTGKPNDMLVFKIGTTKETRELLAERRAALALNANAPAKQLRTA